MRVSVKRGTLGRWRWFIRDYRGKFRGSGPIRGFPSKYTATRDAKEVLGNAMYVETENGEAFAGSRDFSD